MNSYDYNIGYLPGTEQKGSIKKLIKWLFFALAIFLAVQILQATSQKGGDRKQLKAKAAETSQDVKLDSDKLTTESTRAEVTNTVATKEVGVDNSSKTKPILTPKKELASRSDMAIRVNGVSKDESNKVEKNLDKSNGNSETFDQDLANLINDVFPE